MRVPVERCGAKACAYNQHKHCHAVSVEIGKEDATCDLFTRSVMFVVNPHFHSQVCLCRMSGCAKNRLGGCTRDKVAVDGSPAGAVCHDFVNRLKVLAENTK